MAFLTLNLKGLKDGGIQYRQILMIGVLYSLQHAFRANLTVSILPMTDIKLANLHYQQFNWDEETKGLLLSAFYWGYPILQLPAGVLAERYGAKYIIGFAMIFCSLLTFITPFSAFYGGWIGLWFTRFCQGLWQGCFPAPSNVFLTQWIPEQDRNGVYSLVFCGVYAGLLMVLASAGFIAASSGGWPSIFYIYSIFAFIWCLVWCFTSTSIPQSNSSSPVVEGNQQIEMSERNKLTDDQRFYTPWQRILTSRPFWALVTAHFGRNWGSATLVTQIPSYIAYIYKTQIQESGILSALPNAVTIIFILTFSVICQYVNSRNICSLTIQRKLWTSVALGGSAIMLIILTRVGSEHEAIGMLLLILAVAFQAGAYTGILSNHTDLSPNYCGTLMGISSVVGNISSPIAPLCAGLLIKDKGNIYQWNNVFLLTAGIMIASNITFILFSSAEVQDWNDPVNVENPT